MYFHVCQGSEFKILNTSSKIEDAENFVLEELDKRNITIIRTDEPKYSEFLDMCKNTNIELGMPPISSISCKYNQLSAKQNRDDYYAIFASTDSLESSEENKLMVMYN